MYFRGMSDWNLAELEDINWDVFDRTDDHIVPRRGIELLVESSAPSDAQKKPRNDVKNDVGKNMCSRDSVTNTVFWGEEDTYNPPIKNRSAPILKGSQSNTSNIVVPTLCDFESSANGTALPSEDDKILDSCVNESSSIANSNMFCLKAPSLGATVLTNDSKSCLSSLNGISPDVTDLSVLESNQKGRDSDLAYYDWPDISNFEDIDKMFRNWDSTFGQGQTGTADELSWFSSSSNTIYGSEIAFDPGFQSSSSDFGALHAKLESHCSNVNLLPTKVPATVCNKPTSSNYADWLGTDAPSKVKYAGKEKSFGVGDKIHDSGLTQINNEHSVNQSESSDVKIESHQSTEDKRQKISTEQMLLNSDVSAPRIYSSQQVSQQKHFIGSSSSSYTHNLNPHSQLEFGFPVHQLPFTQITSSVESEKGTNPPLSYKVSDHIVHCPRQCLEGLPDQLCLPQVVTSEDLGELYQRQQLCDATTDEYPHQPVFQSKISNEKKVLETRDDDEMEDAGLGLPAVEMDHPIAPECSGMTSVSSDEISEKVTSFQQLQGVMHQLDVRTKLCIRDSLYRLARSARQRHGWTVHNCSEAATDTKGIQGTEASKRSAEYINAEANTNPIDRSIAQLLFRKPSEPTTRSAVGTKSPESIMMCGQVGPITNNVLVPDQFDHQRMFGGSNDMETDLP